MSTNTHIIAPEKVMALLDGELSTDRAESISAHIQDCAECRELANTLRSKSQSLSNWTVPALAANPHFENSLCETVRCISSVPPPVSSFPVSAFLRRHWILTACSALAVGIALTPLMRRPVSQRQVAQVREMALRPVEGFPPGGQPTAGQLSKVGSLTTLAAPSAVRDDNGLFHGTGDDAQNSFSVDGQALADQQSRIIRGPMIARTISLSVMVKDFEKSRASLDAILARHHGYAANLSVNTQQNTARSLQASVRIPVAELNAAIAELKSLGQVQNETQNGEEVTQQHADLVARLKNSRETEQRLQAILQQRTGKISDVLAVEQEIARVRGEIEQMEAEQKSLEHRVNFAAVDLTLAEEYKARIGSPLPSISTRLHNALIAGYQDAIETLVGIILFLAACGPTILIWLAFLFPVAWLLRRRWLRANTVASSSSA